MFDTSGIFLSRNEEMETPLSPQAQADLDAYHKAIEGRFAMYNSKELLPGAFYRMTSYKARLKTLMDVYGMNYRKADYQADRLGILCSIYRHREYEGDYKSEQNARNWEYQELKG